MTISARPRVLVLSFSKVASDARVLKQIERLQEAFDVVSCGFGPSPRIDVEHVELNASEPRLAVLLRAALIRLRLYRLAYWSTPAVRQTRRVLRPQRFDAILANDLDTAGVASAIGDRRRVHLDIHEYWPGLHDNVSSWRKLRQPFYRWQLRTYARRARSMTTVSDEIARRYRDEFGLVAGVVHNASVFQELTPSPVNTPLRLVHSGGSQPSRRIENMMRGVAASTTGCTLDLYLVGGGTEYYRNLEALADDLGDRIRILPPVRPEALVETLNAYDVGVHVLPPTNTNNALALPNKFFDYVQARLAMIIGPTQAMADLLAQYDLGIVTDDFDPASLTRAIERLDDQRVSSFKSSAGDAAKRLSAGPQNDIWFSAITAIAPVETRQS